MDTSEAFPTRLYDGDTFDYQGRTFKVKFTPDYDHEPPWEDGDGQGIVENVYTRERSKRPGQRLLHSDRGDKWYFDWQGTIAKAKKEGWGLCEEERAKLAAKLGREPTKGEVTAESVERNFQWMRRFMRDDWSYVGVTVSMLDEDGEEIQDDSVWGVEYDTYNPQYAMEIVKECADNCLSRYEDEQKEAREAQAAYEAKQAALKDAAMRLSILIESTVFGAEAKQARNDDLSTLCHAAGITLD